MAVTVFILFVIILTGWFSVTDLPVALAPAGTCHTVARRFRVPGIMLLLFVGVGLSRPVSPQLVPGRDYAVVIFAATLAVVAVRIFIKDASIVFSLAGAIAGTRMLQSGSSAIRWSVPLSWLAAVIFTILIAIILCKVISAISSRSDCHLLTKMNRMGLAMTIAASALMLAIGFNLGGLVPSVSTLEFQLLVFAAVAIAICLLVKGEAGSNSHRLMERCFDVNAEAALAMTLATALVTLIFSFDLRIGNIQLKATPLAPGLLMLAGLAGCELAQNKEVNWMPLASKIGTDALLTPLLTPLLAMILACLIFGMIHPNLFSLVNAQVGLLIMLLALVSGGLTVMSFLYLRASKTSGRTLREMDDELNENRRAINEMEIKTMQAENENLHNLLDLKRKELVSVAMNLSEQKEFMDGLYEKVKQAQAEMEPEKKDELLHELRTDLNLRRNFSNEIDSFYAQVETLHKDFTARMTERFPQLTKQERRLAMLLRLGFSTKYIATLMNIAPTSVEIGRHRLRAKLGLARGQNLTEFVKTI